MNNLGFAYLRANENAKAVEVLTPASEKLTTVAYVHNNLGVALERMGRKDEAKAAYLHAMDLSPKYVKARVNADRVARSEVPVFDDATPEPVATPAEPESLSDIPHPMP
jgi:tetratricopeptide (TPR) repeat protein